MKNILFLLFILLLLFGCNSKSTLGFKSKSDCEDILNLGAKMKCLHVAAVTAAYANDVSSAESICSEIWTNIGQNRPSDDFKTQAELETNNCYYDIAKITARTTSDYRLCYGISKRTQSIQSTLFGEQVTQKMCIQELDSIRSVSPDNYYRNNPNNLCALIFIVPFILLYSKAAQTK